MRLTLLAALGLALTACSPAPEQAVAPAAQDETPATPGASVEFMAPSGNIGCIYIPAGGTAVYQTADGGAELQCDRIEPAYVRVVLPENGPARIVETQERGCCSGETIQYDQRWADGPFSCDVSEAALTCEGALGHGFTLSRTQADVR